jgi:hypothetical protein
MNPSESQSAYSPDSSRKEMIMSPEQTTFLTTLGAGSLALLTFFFLTLQQSRSSWIKKPLRKLIAIQTLLEFLIPAFFTLIALLPMKASFFGQPTAGWQGGGMLVGIGGGLVALLISYRAITQHQLDPFGKQQLWLQPLALIEYALLFISSFLGSFVWTALLLIWLLVSGSWEAWRFFSELD